MKEPQLAFPVIGTIAGKPNALGQQQMMGIYQSGMTLRDFFASAAMQGMLSSGRMNLDKHVGDLSVAAYAHADAMLFERDRLTSKELSNGK